MAVIVAVAACGRAEAPVEVGADPALRFEASAPTLQLLGEQVLAALSRGDRGALEELRLTEHEHNDVVWPELPASAPEVNFPIDYAWLNIENRNRRGLERIVPLYQDRRIGFQRVECRGATERFDTFVVLTDCWVVFSASAAPTLFEAQIFKDVIVRGGGHKIFRYYDEEPRPYRGGASRASHGVP